MLTDEGALPECNWDGWDVVVTRDGFKVIEDNPGPDITFQLFGRPVPATGALAVSRVG